MMTPEQEQAVERLKRQAELPSNRGFFFAGRDDFNHMLSALRTALEDSRRLDWLHNNIDKFAIGSREGSGVYIFTHAYDFGGDDLRAAIDAATTPKTKEGDDCRTSYELHCKETQQDIDEEMYLEWKSAWHASRAAMKGEKV